MCLFKEWLHLKSKPTINLQNKTYMFAFASKMKKKNKPMKIETSVVPTAPKSTIKQAVYNVIAYFKK